MNMSRRKPNVNTPGTLKNKTYKALNMRQPAGATILELQQMEKMGQLSRPDVGDENYPGDMIYRFEDKFTDIEIEKFKEAFVFFDRQGDGTMKASDVCLAMRAMGALVTEKEVQNLLKKYDPDGVGTIDANDFIACMAEVVDKEDNPSEIRNAFSVFDKDDNGLMPVEEMRHVLTRIGDPLSQEEITNFLNILDMHGDGYVRMNELMALLTPQTNKDLYAKTVGGEGIERSHMSYGAAQINTEELKQSQDTRQQTNLAAPALQSTPQSNQNSGTKKQRKTYRKQGQSDVGQNRASGSGNFEVLMNKYKDIAGASEWFQIKKLELESQKKSIASLPQQHQWKPPRIDGDRYQCAMNIQREDQTEEKDNSNKQRINNNNQDENELLKSSLQKRRKRSYSFDRHHEFHQNKRQMISQSLSIDISVNEPEEQKNDRQVVEKPAEVKDVYDVRNENNHEEKVKEYIELAEFIMRGTNSSCNGIWLKGSLTGYIEKALQLLHSYNYNFTLAKFHILYPSVMAMPDRKEEILTSLTEKEMESIVTDAIIDLRGCKSQEADEAIANIRNALKNKLTLDDLNYYQQVLKKLRVEMPADIEQEIINSREFSKLIKKRCGPQTGGGAAAQIPVEKKMKLSELLKMQEEAQTYSILTPEMGLLTEYVKRANQWMEKTEQIKNQVVNVKQLQNLLQEAKSIPVNFEQQMEDLKKRFNDAQALVDKIYNTFIKVTKTRTQVNQLENQSLKEKKKQQELFKKEKKKKEQQFRDLLKEADELMIINPEVQKLRDHMDEVDQWKARVLLFLEDEPEQKQRKEVFYQLIKETLLFKIEVELTDDLQRKLEFIEWNEKVDKIYYQLFPKIKNEEGTDKKKVKIEELQNIMQEGEAKGFADLPIENIQKVGEICIRANKYQQELSKSLQQVRDNKEEVELRELLRFQQEGEEFMIEMEEINELEIIINEAKELDNKCQFYIKESQQVNQQNDEELKKEDKQILVELKEMLILRQQINKIGIKHNSYTQFFKIVKPILIWIKYSRIIIKSYYKTLEISLSQQNLLDQQDVDSDDSESSDGDVKMQDEENKEKPQMMKQKRNKIPDNDYEILQFLLNEANNNFKILIITNDYQILNDLQSKVNQWINKINQLETDKQQLVQVQIVENLEKLISENLPLPYDLIIKTQKWLRREKWLKRLNELYSNEKVKIKQIESLVKDSNHNDIQENEKCKEEAEILKQQLMQCKEWINLQLATETNTQEEIKRLLDLGKGLKINLQDYVDLKSFYQDVTDWRDKTIDIFRQKKSLDNNYDGIRKHIDLGIQLDISDKDMEMLKQLVEMCAHWKSLARKVIKSRELCKLEIQNAIDQTMVEEVDTFIEGDLILILNKQQKIDGTTEYNIDEIKGLSNNVQKDSQQEQYYDNQQYCICRRGDDGMVFMIECDICKEWFHGDCIGLNKNQGSKLQQYVCICCARVHYNFEIYGKNEELFEGLDPELLRTFTTQRRASYKFFQDMLQEGENLPIYLEEMADLRRIAKRIDVWLDKVEPFIGENMLQESEDSSEMIINTKVSNQALNARQGKEEDLVSKTILKLYLESESFPVEIPEAEILILLLKQRKWMAEAQKMINLAIKQNKVQQKKIIKKLISQANDLKIENDPKLIQIANQLNSLLGSQNQNFQFSQQIPVNSYITEQLDLLFKEEGGAAQYGNCIELIEHVENNGIAETADDKMKIEDLKQLLSSYTVWLSQVRDCLNHGEHIEQKFCNLMGDGEKLFWMITSVEKEQYFQIYQNYANWMGEANNTLAQLQNQNIIFNNPENFNYYINELEQLLEQAKQIPFEISMVSEIEEKVKQMMAIQNVVVEVPELPKEINTNMLQSQQDKDNDFFK